MTQLLPGFDQKVSIIIPVYNGAMTIASLVRQLISVCGVKNLQIVLVNDGSQDNSHIECCALAQQNPGVVTYVNLAKNFGEHNAVMAGLSFSKGDYMVIMDDDFQNPPQEVINLVRAAQEEDYDAVYSRYAKKEHSPMRNWGSRFNNWVATFMLQKPPELYLSSFKVLNRFVVNEVLKYNGPFPYIDGLVLRSTRNIGSIEIKHEKRKEGHSGYTLRKLIRLWLNMFVNFSVMPLRVSTLLGFICSGLGLIFSIYIIVEKLMHPDLPIGWPSLMIIVIFFAGVQLIILGLLGEYLGRLFLSSNQTPQYVVREVYDQYNV